MLEEDRGLIFRSILFLVGTGRIGSRPRQALQIVGGKDSILGETKPMEVKSAMVE